MNRLTIKTKQPYTPPNKAKPFLCNLCNTPFPERDAVRRHYFNNYRRYPSAGCWQAHGKPTETYWWDHPSCANEGGRAFYPDWYVYAPQSGGGKLLVWPERDAGEGWPTEEAELLRRNGDYMRRPDANPWFVTGVPYTEKQRSVNEELGRFKRDGAARRFAVQVREEEACPGEDPEVQLRFLLDIVTPESYAGLVEVSKTLDGRESGGMDDVFLTVALHTSDQDLAAHLGFELEDAEDWLDQAIANFAAVHFLASDGRPQISEPDGTEDLVERFRQRHVDGAGGEWKQRACCKNGKLKRLIEAKASSHNATVRGA
ncbi:hypothetical protein B0A55_13058 [Friedmanniomyces simplex]|uniref:C2H2-type domain-containing protein n=1 Tax=Friedmanniomyces simplex TaxID=329884 RepID=A0A4U0W2L5_9PEZI|nr:hypothetical protein B0A55_13058 [Friedmanniomyces simplex]